jgi:RND family efflux transporter MFP subunit
MSKPKKRLFLIISALIITLVFIVASRVSEKAPVANETKSTGPLNVSVQEAKNSAVLSQNIQYPAVVAGDQEATLTARTGGTIKEINFDLGSRVVEGSRIAVIDDTGSFSKEGTKDLQSNTTQILELTVKSTEAKYKSAKDSYENNKTFANKKARDVAKLDWESAKVNLRSALDDRFVVSPISGSVTERFVNLGDSVAAGQTIATISKTGLTKIQFFVNKEELSNFKIGSPITIQEDGNDSKGIVVRIAPVADPATRRFLIEARSAEKKSFLIGSIINVALKIERSVKQPGNLILPLSALTIGQNENYLFIIENGRAKKINITILDVAGEAAEIKADIPADAKIIINGNKLLKDGDLISLGN